MKHFNPQKFDQRITGNSSKTSLAAAADLMLGVVHDDVRRSVHAGDDGLRHRGVLGLPVPPQIHLPLESLVAEAAGEGLVSGVFAHVRDEIGRLAERLGAHHALVGFLS